MNVYMNVLFKVMICNIEHVSKRKYVVKDIYKICPMRLLEVYKVCSIDMCFIMQYFCEPKKLA